MYPTLAALPLELDQVMSLEAHVRGHIQADGLVLVQGEVGSGQAQRGGLPGV